MNITLKIQRFDPKENTESYFQEYSVEAEPSDRVLDALINVKRNQDGSLGFRRSCAHGVCGSDAMIINGKEALACKTLIQDVIDSGGGAENGEAEGASTAKNSATKGAESGTSANNSATITLLPLKHQPVQRDLMVDQTEFFQKYRDVQPFFIPQDADDGGEHAEQTQAEQAQAEQIQTVEQRNFFDDPTKCILCSACYSACPVLDKNPDFIGPAAIVQAARFVNDSRDKGLEPRLTALDSPDGVWPCENNFHCTEVCPREIPVTKLINQTKRQIKKYREERGEAINDAGQDEAQKAARRAQRAQK